MPSSRAILGAATAAHALVGAWIATSMTGPLLAIDDLAYLSIGRTLAGGGASPLPAQPPYGVLYPLLLAPGWLVGLDEPQMVVFAQVVNAVLGALLIPVLFALVRRLSDASFGRALGAAAIGASLPAALLTGTIVWTERLLPLLVGLAVLALLRLRDAPTRRRGVEVAVVAVGLFATHPRMGPVALVVLVAAVRTLWTRGARRPLVATASVGALGIAFAELARRLLADASFGADATYDVADLARNRGLDEVTGMVVRGGGTVAYLVLATAGLAVLGLFVLVRDRETAIAYGAMLAATVVVAGWFLSGVDRADAFLHGRYIEVLAPLLVTLGVVAAGALPWRLGATVVTVSVVVAGLYGAWAGPGDVWARSRTPVMMLGTEVAGAPFGQLIFEPGAAASLALFAGLLVLAAARRGAWVVPVVAAVIVAVAVLSGREAIDSLQERSVVGQVQAALGEVDGIDELVIDIDRVPSTLAGAVAWQVGFDHVVPEPTNETTHLLLVTDAVAPDGAVAVAEFAGGVVWALR
jgi:hypothetical protein